MISKDITGQLHEGHPTARRDLDRPDDHYFVGLNTPFPDMPTRDRVLRIHLGSLEESFHRSPDVLSELGQSDGIAIGRFVADLYLSLELSIPTPL